MSEPNDSTVESSLDEDELEDSLSLEDEPDSESDEPDDELDEESDSFLRRRFSRRLRSSRLRS